MLRSLFTAVTGVRAHQTMLDVTGNNIANANTTGFKKDFTIFADMMYQSQKYASGAGDTRGGVNPAQVGLGVSVSAIETIHTQGSASYTGNPSDMMIQGRGFFVYRSGTQNYYSRSGATVLDANSNLVQAGTGNYLQGYEITEDPLDPTQYVRASELSNVNIQIGEKLDPKATYEVRFQCNLDSRSSAYLPYGFADLPFNANAGLSKTDSSGTAKVSFDGDDYELSFQTDLTNTNGTNYLTITLDDGVTTPAPTIAFDMIGINDDGTPILNCTTAYPITLGPSGTNQYNIIYDDDTGLLKLKNITTNEVVFQNNLKAGMNYKSFTITDTTVDPKVPYPVIAEFDESITNGSPSELAQTGATLTMWWEDPAAPGVVNQMQAQVFFNPDGTFASVEPVTGTFPGPFSATSFKIEPSDNGQYLEIQQAKDPSNANSSFQNIAQINIGGYHATKTTIYDSLGNQHTLEVNFKKDAKENRWRWEAFLVTDDAAIEYNVGMPNPNCGEIEFNGDGTIHNVVSSDGTRHAVSDGENVYMEIDVPFSMNGSENSTVLLNFGGGIGKNAGDVLNGVTQFASETTTKAVYQDGYPMGVLENYSIGQDGTITGMYSNGKNIPLYRVAIATFANEQGLEKIGDTMFRETANSGTANIDPAQVNGKGTIISQTLEMSNVDLTEEFTHLIIAQRGFQANTRVITTSDQILEEVVNLKR